MTDPADARVFDMLRGAAAIAFRLRVTSGKYQIEFNYGSLDEENCHKTIDFLRICLGIIIDAKP